MTYKEAEWKTLEERIRTEMTKTMGDAQSATAYTAEMMAEFQNFYQIYDTGVVDWFANLYEPNIQFTMTEDAAQKARFSGGAGFYYSNSARNQYSALWCHGGELDGMEFQLLPDPETTAQVFGFIANSGMLDDAGGDIRAAFPEGEAEKIIRYLKSIQDADTGCFYPPQWRKILGTPHYRESRRSRDMTYALSALGRLGAKPTYDTPTGTAGDGILYDGTKVASEVVREETGEAKPQKTIATHPYLVSRESFRAYLDTLDLAKNSYFVGNELGSRASELMQRDREIGTPEDPRPLATMLDAWLREHQNPETGYWHDTEKYPTEHVYTPTNGLLKIAAMYNTLKLPFPNPLAAAKSAFAVIADPWPPRIVCDLYNTWFIVSMIYHNLTRYSGNPELAEKIVADVRVAALPAVRATAEKMKAFRKADGSFSYYTTHCCPTSQGHLVAEVHQNEGDVNATVIFTYGILDFMFSALGFGRPIRLCDGADRERFKAILADKAKACGGL